MSNIFVIAPPGLELSTPIAGHPLRFRKQVIYKGGFVKAQGDTRLAFEVDEALLQHWHNTFKAFQASGVEVPLPLGHTEDPEKRRGTVLDLEIALDAKKRPSLFSIIEFSDAEAAKLARSDVSIYVPPDWTDGKGQKYYRPIRHVAITDYPVIPGLEKFQVLAASLTEETSMTLADLAKKVGVEGEDDAALADGIVALIEDLKKQVETAKGEEKKPEEKKPEEKPAPVAAAFTSMAVELRQTKINKLVGEGRITTAVGTDLATRYCDPKKVELVLSSASVDDFDAIMGILAKQEPVINFKGKTGPQSLSLSGTDGKDGKPQESSLVKNAERRRAAASK